MKPSKKYYLGALYLLVILVVGILFVQQGFAWTNPVGAPPFANPSITSSGGNVGIGGATPAANEKLRIETPNSIWGLMFSRSGVPVGGIHANSGVLTLQLDTGSAMVALSGNNVGIGTSGPGEKLDVVGGNIRVDNTHSFYGSNTSGNSVTLLRVDSSNKTQIGDTTTASAMTLTGGSVGIGTASPDANYRLTTSGGGVKAENSHATNPAGYFNNAGGGPAITAGAGGITLGGVNRTAWTTGADNLGDHTATAALNMAGNDISSVQNMSIRGTLAPFAVGSDSGLTGDRPYQFGYQEGGAWTSPYPDLILGYHTGVKIGGYYNYNGTRFYNNHPSRPGATEIFSVGNGDNHVRVLNDLYVTGNIGIGTSAPVAKLDLGTSGFARAYSSGGSGWGGSTNTAGFRTAWNTGYGASFEAWDGGAPKWGIYRWNANTPAVVMQGQYDTNDINFTGNIAIGTTSAGAYKLNVSGDANATRLCIAGVCQSVWPTGTDATKVLKVGDTMTGNLSFGSVGLGTVGTYDPAKTQAVWAMGPSYILPAGGGTTNYGSLYGLGWSYNPDYGGAGNNPQSKAGLNHQLLIMNNGVTQSAIGTGIWTNGIITAGAGGVTLGGVNRTTWPSSGIGGSGTANYIPKWTAGTTLGNSQVFDNGTNVGIGTQTPTSGKLQIYHGNVISEGTVNTDANRNNGFLLWTDRAFGSELGYGQAASGHSGGWATNIFGRASEVAAIRFGTYPTYSDLSTDFVERMTLLANGNFGIGTVAPGAMLEVNGSVYIKGGNGDVVAPFTGTPDVADALKILRYTMQLEIPTPAQFATADISGDGVLNDDDYYTALRVSIGLETIAQANMSSKLRSGTLIYKDVANARIGIGTSAPGAMLEVSGSAYIKGGNGDVVAPFGGTLDVLDALRILNYAAGTIIPTPAQFAVADISGDGVLNDDDYYSAMKVVVGLQTIEQANLYSKLRSGTLIYKDTANTRLGINTGSPGYTLTVNGQPGANGYTAFTNYSDSRLKENITNVSSGILDKIRALNPVTFNYNTHSGYDEDTRKRTVTGFIAQDLQKVFPQMVGHTTINGVEYLDSNLSALPIYLVKAVQEQQKQIDDQKQQIEQQRKDIDMLKQNINK